MLKARSGYWHVDFYLPSGKRVRGTTGVPLTGSKRDALARHQSMEQEALQASEGAPAGPSGMTLRDAFKTALVEHTKWRTSTARRTIEDNYGHVSAHFGPGRCLSTITSEAISEYKGSLLAAGKASSTINQRLSLLSVLFEVAQEQGAKVTRPRIKREPVQQGRIRILTRDEERQVVEWFANSPAKGLLMADLVECLLDTGFRLSEMLRVSRRDVSWERQQLTAWQTKNGDARTIPMTQRVSRILHRRLQESEVAFGALTVDSADNRWEAMRRATGLAGDREFVLHALRHTCCSRLVAAGMDAFRVQRWMGHRSIKTTQLYVTLGAPDLCALARALEDVSGHTRPTRVTAGSSGYPIESGMLSTVNPQVPGSSPGRGAKENNDLGPQKDAHPDHVPRDVTTEESLIPHPNGDAPLTT